MKSLTTVQCTLIALLFAGCATTNSTQYERKAFKHDYQIACAPGLNQVSANGSAIVAVAQGVPIKYRVKAEGCRVHMIARGGFSEKQTLAEKTGQEFDGQITTNYTGLMEFYFEAAEQGSGIVHFEAE